MPKGQFPKLKGAICNIRIETMDITNTLPQGSDRKESYIFEAMYIFRPFLQYLFMLLFRI